MGREGAEKGVGGGGYRKGLDVHTEQQEERGREEKEESFVLNHFRTESMSPQ